MSTTRCSGTAEAAASEGNSPVYFDGIRFGDAAYIPDRQAADYPVPARSGCIDADGADSLFCGSTPEEKAQSETKS